MRIGGLRSNGLLKWSEQSDDAVLVRALRPSLTPAEPAPSTLFRRALAVVRAPGRVDALGVSRPFRPSLPNDLGRTSVHPEVPTKIEPSDALEPFQQLVLVVRWGVLALSFVQWSASSGRPIGGGIALLAMLLWTAIRTLRPVRFDGSTPAIALAIVAELFVGVVAVVGTGHWNSPLVFCLLPGVVIAGFAQSGPTIGLLGLMVGLVVTITEAGGRLLEAEHLRTSLQWTTELALVALVAGVGHRMLREAEKTHNDALSRMSQLTEANDLLQALHRVSQTLPSSLDLDDVLTSTVTTVREITEAPIVAILLRDDTLPSWVVGRAEGVRTPAMLNPDELPTGVRAAAQSRIPVAAAVATGFEAQGMTSPDTAKMLAATAVKGLYAPLLARTELLGVLVVEWTSWDADVARTKEFLSRLGEPAAIAIDNARWFRRIRTATADEERTRIARDLHDRIGQSLAYLAFELDRLRRQAVDTPLESELDRMRGEVRKVVGEVRETLYDLRTEIDQRTGLAATLSGFLERLEHRTSMKCTLEADDFDGGTAKELPMRAERELWRIAQEAITNVERHASASNLRIAWRSNGHQALLEIADDGKGFGAGAGRADSYGMLGIRERAAAIGARLEMESSPGQGTLIRCRWEEEHRKPGSTHTP